ncbi:MAG: glycosyltransferase family 8 protein [Lachnospiraceae bacterium]|nr:glycosyltransferase family 8 protein [Lachnospiraceae bacterium]
MNIAVSVNNKFVMPLKVMLFSLAQNTERDLVIYLLYCDLDENKRIEIEKFVQQYCHGVVRSILVEQGIFREHDASKSMYSIEAFYRLLIPYILPNDVERVLWLDADMVVYDEIDEFYDSQFGTSGEAMLVACWNEKDKVRIPEYKERLGIKTDYYFNSGVILFNIPQIRKHISKEEINDFWIKNQKILYYPDQDILNCLMGEKTVYKSATEYNNLSHLEENGERELLQAKIIHYAFFMKPWLLYYEGKCEKPFWNYAKQCGYKMHYIFYCIMHKPTLFVYKIYKRVRYGEKIKKS